MAERGRTVTTEAPVLVFRVGDRVALREWLNPARNAVPPAPGTLGTVTSVAAGSLVWTYAYAVAWDGWGGETGVPMRAAELGAVPS